MLKILLTISPFFMLIAIGYFIRIFIANDKWVEVLNKFGLFLGFPAIVLNSFFKLENGFPVKSNIIAYNLIILLFVIFILYSVTRVLKFDKALSNTYVLCSFFGNIAYLGFPFVTSVIHGSEGIVCIHIAIYLIVVFTLGILILEISRNHGTLSILLIIKNIFQNPLLASVFIGLLISSYEIKNVKTKTSL